jgi:hypothetical protein
MAIDQSDSDSSTDIPSSSSPSTINYFSAIISSHSQQAVNDDQDSEAIRPSSPWVHVPIGELFDFKTKYWESLYTRFAALSFEDELAL